MYTGIYKITSPSNKIYIGQSINIEKRFEQYYKLQCKSQVRLFNSFNFYNVNNHKFEIIEECSIELLNERERYWQEYYNVIDKGGLNCEYVKTTNKKRKLTKHRIDKLKILRINAKLTIEHKKKLSYSKLGKKLTKKHCENISKGKRGIKLSESHKKNLKNTFKPKKIINTKTKKIYKSLREASIVYNINYYTLSSYLNGNRTNKTNLSYV